MTTSMTSRVVEDLQKRSIFLAGGITEESDFHSLVPDESRFVMIDLGSVELINSCGVREWINFVRALEQQGCTLKYENCSPPFVRQLNMISNFRGNGVVQSVLLPYFCDDCEHEEMKAIEMTERVCEEDISETIPCPKCGAEMFFDDMKDSYLEFRHH